MPCTTSFKCQHMRARQYTLGMGEDASMALLNVSFAHLDAGRCCGRKSLAALLGRVCVRPRFCIRQPRRVLHCSCHFASMRTVSSERRSAQRATACHRACFLVGDELEGRTLREALRYRCLTRCCWWVRCTHHRRGMTRLVRAGRSEGRTRAPYLERRRTTEQHARWTRPPHHLL